MQSSQKKILCLHGNAANSEIMTLQLKQFQNEFKNIQFITFDAPIEVSKDIIWNEKFAQMVQDKNQTTVYAWGSFLKMKQEDIYEGFAIGLNALITVLKEQGPFYGVMGFSQGSNIVSRLAVLIANKNIILDYELQCFIFFSGVPCIQGQNQMCKTPSIHFVGFNDFLLDRSMALTTQFLNPLVIYHNQGHRIPILTHEQVQHLRLFFKDISSTNWSRYLYMPKL